MKTKDKCLCSEQTIAAVVHSLTQRSQTDAGSFLSFLSLTFFFAMLMNVACSTNTNECGSDADCKSKGSDYVCQAGSQGTKTCTLKSATTENCKPACAADEVCQNNKCEKQATSDCKPACAADEVCKNNKCEKQATSDCKPACAADEVCKNNKCEKTNTQDCKPACGSGQKCLEGKCVDKSYCQLNSHCSSGYICDKASSKCVEERANVGESCRYDKCADGLACFAVSAADKNCFEPCNSDGDCKDSFRNKCVDFYIATLGTSGKFCMQEAKVGDKCEISGPKLIGCEAPHFCDFNVYRCMPRPLIDPRDKREYKTVAIGHQVWMAENLDYKSTASICAYRSSGSSCEFYGRHYSWKDLMAAATSSDKSPSGVQGLCPPGWHVPSVAEFELLGKNTAALFSVTEGNSDGKWKVAALLKWNASNPPSPRGWKGEDEADHNDNARFSLMPAGYSYNSINGGGQWKEARLWTSTESDMDDAFYYAVQSANPYFFREKGSKTDLYSVRCVKD